MFDPDVYSDQQHRSVAYCLRRLSMQAKQLAEWGVEGVIVGSALVKALGEASSPVSRLRGLFSVRMARQGGSIRHTLCASGSTV